MQGALERCECFMYLCEKRRVYVKRDVFMWLETRVRTSNAGSSSDMCMSSERDVFKSKETCLCEKRRIYVKRDVFMWKETYLCDERPEYAQVMQEPSRDVKWFCEKRRIYVKRDVYVWKETYSSRDVNLSCHTWMSDVTYEWDMSHLNGTCHIWMSHVTSEWVMSHEFTREWVMTHLNESRHIWVSHVTHERVISHTQISREEPLASPQDMWISHVICEWVMSHMSESCRTWTSHVTHSAWARKNTSRHDVTCKWCHIWMSHVTHEWVMSHMNESCLTFRVRTSTAERWGAGVEYHFQEI